MSRAVVGRAGVGRGGVGGWVETQWRGGGRGPGAWLFQVLTLPLELVFRLGVALRALRFALVGGRSVPVPVISVGNLSVGGTGKTPVSAWLVAQLAGMGKTPALVARGYGQDELALHRRWNPLAGLEAGADRVEAAGRAAKGGADVVVLDDGFQHRALNRDMDVVLVAAEQGVPGALIPRGPFREGLGALGRAQAVLITRKTADPSRAEALRARLQARFPGLLVATARLTPGPWQALDGTPASAPSGPVLAVSSIAGPEAFRELVSEELGTSCDSRVFPDHHDYSPEDLERVEEAAEGRCVVVTEKDAVKLQGLWTSSTPIRVLPLELRFEEGEAQFLDAISGVVA